MANSLRTVVDSMVEGDAFRKAMVNPLSQFGRAPREYLGARFLPERLVPNNSYRETAIRYRTVVANDASRYSPAQKKGNDIVGSMRVELGEQDIASEFTSEDYDTYIEIDKINQMNGNSGNASLSGMVGTLRWFDNRIVMPLLEKIEKQRWEAIVDAQVPLTGDGINETVQLSDPAGHRVAAAGDWTDPTYNPLDDIYDMLNFMADLGYTVGALAAGRPVIYTLLRHPKIQAAIGGYINVQGGALVANTTQPNPAALNAYLAQSGLPPITEYNLQYRDENTDHYFLKRDVLVATALTGRDRAIDLGDDEQLPLRETLGYVGVGRAAGQAASGRAYSVQVFDNKPPRAEFEGWQTSFPIVTDPEAIYVIKNITTSNASSSSSS